MKKIVLLVALSICTNSYLMAQQICKAIGPNNTIISVDCETGEQILTEDERIELLEKRIQQKKEALKNNTYYRQQNRYDKPSYRNYKTYQTITDSSLYSEGIQNGDWMLSVNIGPGTVINANEDIIKKQTVWTMGVSGMFFPVPELGLGLGFENSSIYSLKKYDGWVTGHVYQNKIMLLGRVNFNPRHQVRAYMPFGIGRNHTSSQIKARGVGSFSDSWNSISYFIGAGVEFDLNKQISLGLETRYNSAEDPDKEVYGYLNGLLKLNIKL